MLCRKCVFSKPKGHREWGFNCSYEVHSDQGFLSEGVGQAASGAQAAKENFCYWWSMQGIGSRKPSHQVML